MNIFFDTNVLISAFITQGICADIFEYCVINHQVYISDVVLKEIKKVMTKKFKYSDIDVKEVLVYLNAHTTVVTATLFKQKISRDRTDDGILAAADESESTMLISGDKDLLELKRFKNFVIISPKDFWKYV